MFRDIIRFFPVFSRLLTGNHIPALRTIHIVRAGVLFSAHSGSFVGRRARGRVARRGASRECAGCRRTFLRYRIELTSCSPHGPSQDREARQLKPRQAVDLFLLGFHLLVEAIAVFVVVHVRVEETVVRFRPSLASFDEFLRKGKVFVLDEFADRIGEGRHAVVDVDVEKRLAFHGTVLEESPLVNAGCAACTTSAASSGEEKGRCDASTTHLRPTIIASSRPIHPLCART